MLGIVLGAWALAGLASGTALVVDRAVQLQRVTIQASAVTLAPDAVRPGPVWTVVTLERARFTMLVLLGPLRSGELERIETEGLQLGAGTSSWVPYPGEPPVVGARLDVVAVYDQGEVTLRVPEMGVLGFGESLNEATEDLLVELRDYAARFFREPAPFMATSRGGHAAALLRFALADEEEQRRMLSEAADARQVGRKQPGLAVAGRRRPRGTRSVRS